ncbi:hypothetical protein [Gemelliphila palaticanis]|uniref:DUF1492 domain-containing protein n=1 Tax=Gemelliphila palaticanis TaxID=81950 RepID=A0ABX2SZI4_9BACL|nr:hypothetical protein [Gemella palaticanis]MBF0714654.1 hypothetical protein [Gemella palaticanis]NYS46584.1 hypothetical protein [Gemella palaticanis]
MKHKAFFIKRFRDIQKEIIDLEYRINNNADNQKLTTTIQQVRVKKSRTRKQDDIVINFEKLEKRLQQLYKKRDEMSEPLIIWFDKLDAINSKIVFKFVIECLSFSEIAKDFHKLKKTVEKMFIKSLELLELDIK